MQAIQHRQYSWQRINPESLSGWPFQTISTCCLFTAGSRQQTSINTLLCILKLRQSFETIPLSILPPDLFFLDWFSLFLPSCYFACEWVSITLWCRRGQQLFDKIFGKTCLFWVDLSTWRFVNKLRAESCRIVEKLKSSPV